MVKIFTKLIVFTVVGFLPVVLFAATLFISPTASTYNIGNTFSVDIYVSSVDKAMNAVSSIISFPTDKLEVVSISKTGSLLSLWAQEPSFSNGLGTVSFEGIITNPGFTGAKGKILTVIFKAKAVGVASLIFSSASVLANDGLGTNILTGQIGASFNISSVVPIVPTPQPLVGKCDDLSKLKIVSSTNKPDTWVSSRDSSFSWDISDEIVAIRTSLSARDNSVPSVNYVPPISKKNLVDTPDGIWYFALRYKAGDCWSSISRYKIKIDTKAPINLQAKVVEMASDKQISLELSAEDDLSGIDRYEIVVDGKMVLSVSDKNLINGQYLLSTIPAGEHILRIRAFDLAGNSSEEISLSVNVPIKELPRINEIKNPVASEIFEITGWLGDDNVSAKLYIQEKDGVPLVIDIDNFVGDFVWQGTLKDSGSYQVWLEVSDLNGVKKVSPKVDFKVLSAMLSDFFNIFQKLLKYGIIWILLLIILFILWYLLRKKQTKQPRVDIENIKCFTLMENNVKEYIEVLEKAKKKRTLSNEEGTILLGLKKEIIALDKYFYRQKYLKEKD